MNKELSDSEKLDDIRKRLRRIEISGDIQTLINVMVFLGIATVGSLIHKATK